jgi:hypothetical protein
MVHKEEGGVSETWALGIGFIIVLAAYLIGQFL